MIRLVCLVLAFAFYSVAHATASAALPPSAGAATNRCAAFELKDQFGNLQAIRFPAARPILLTVADKKGSEGIVGWAHPIGEKFGESIQIAGLADVSAVPRRLRTFVQGQFKKAVTHPTMLDWDGTVCAGFNYEKGRPNIYLVARDGRILKHYSGEADPGRLEELMKAIQAEAGSTP